ncbi:MAG: molybdenum ABC transporter ATP-binding protein [Lentilitoribacter sp.]
MLEVDIQKQFVGFNLDICFKTDASVTALFGRSGAGKSTILNLVAGFSKPDNGRITLDGLTLFDSGSGVNLVAHKRGLGMVFQDARLFPHYDITSNLTYANWAGGREANLEFSRVVELLGITHLLDRKPQNLSGGERQRVAIGRALLSSPQLLLLDEPLASLDIERKRTLLRFLKAIRNEFKIPMIFVSHDPMDVHQLAENLVLIDQGKMIEQGGVREVFASHSMQGMLGDRNQSAIIEAMVSGYEQDYGLTVLSVGSSADDISIRLYLENKVAEGPLRLLVHARDVALSLSKPVDTSLQNCLPAMISDISVSDNAHMMVKCHVAGQVLFSRITQKSCDELRLKPGKQVFALIKSVALA